MVAQVAYAGLAACPLLNPLQSAITTLTFANNPYNIFYSNSYRPFDDNLLPHRLRGTQLYSQYIYNVNFVLVFVIVPLILGLILSIVGCCSCLGEYKRQKLSNIGKSLMGQYVFAGLTTVGCVAGCASVLQIKYAMQDMSEGTMSLVVCAVVAFLIVVYAFLWIKLHQKFG